MNMFPNYITIIPKNRSEMVNELDVPDVTLTPYVWTEPDESISARSDSILTSSVDDHEAGTPSTDSSIPLSRAMTDSEIDYGRFRRYKSRSFSDPWDQMKMALEAFPPDYLASLNSFQYSSTDSSEEPIKLERIPRYNEELELKMERFFDQDCRVFTPDDPGLLALEEALQRLDLEALDSDLDSLDRTSIGLH